MEIYYGRSGHCVSVFFGIAILIGCMFCDLAWTQQVEATPEANGSRIARGKYIVEGVAMCGTCHTPRTESGDLDHVRWLDGAVLWLLPAQPTSNWPLRAPRIAGSPAASDDELIRLLTTGIWKDGSRLRPPMPQFRMSREDAEAIVAYLRSLSSSPGD
jgi:mono/diheme cytochrome c family protein